MHFLQKALAWSSNFYLRVQSKICGRNIFFILPFWIFPDFERKIFQTFGQRTSRICRNYLLRVRGNDLWLEFFLSFESFRIFCRNIWHVSQIFIYVSRVKIAEVIAFLFFFSKFFGIWAKNVSDFWPKNFKNLSKLPSACADEQFLAWKFFFLKFWIFLDFLQKASAWFSKFYLRVQSKICGRIIFFILPFWIFSYFERKIFQTFGQKTSRICQNYLLRVQRNNLWLENFWSFESFRIFCRNLWHGSSKIYLSVQSKNCGITSFFLFFFSDFFSNFEQNIFRLLPEKTSKFSEN